MRDDAVLTICVDTKRSALRNKSGGDMIALYSNAKCYFLV